MAIWMTWEAHNHNYMFCRGCSCGNSRSRRGCQPHRVCFELWWTKYKNSLKQKSFLIFPFWVDLNFRSSNKSGRLFSDLVWNFSFSGLFYRLNVFVSENNEVFDAKFKLGISADVVNSHLDANLVGFQDFTRSSNTLHSLKQLFFLKVISFIRDTLPCLHSKPLKWSFWFKDNRSVSQKNSPD